MTLGELTTRTVLELKRLQLPRNPRLRHHGVQLPMCVSITTSLEGVRRKEADLKPGLSILTTLLLLTLGEPTMPRAEMCWCVLEERFTHWCDPAEWKGNFEVVERRCFSHAWTFSHGTGSIQELERGKGHGKGQNAPILLSTNTSHLSLSCACAPPH